MFIYIDNDENKTSFTEIFLKYILGSIKYNKFLYIFDSITQELFIISFPNKY